MCHLFLYLFFFMMCSKGLRKSFWNLKLANSPFSKNFMDSCLRESTAKIATSSLELQPTCSEMEHISVTLKKNNIRFLSIFLNSTSAAFQEQTVPTVRLANEEETVHPAAGKKYFWKSTLQHDKWVFWGFDFYTCQTRFAASRWERCPWIPNY